MRSDRHTECQECRSEIKCGISRGLRIAGEYFIIMLAIVILWEGKWWWNRVVYWSEMVDYNIVQLDINIAANRVILQEQIALSIEMAEQINLIREDTDELLNEINELKGYKDMRINYRRTP